MDITIVSGNLGKDPEVKEGKNSGSKYADFTIASSRWQKGSGDSKGEKVTDWHNVRCFGQTAEFVGQYLHKGDSAIVEGRTEVSTYEDKDGMQKTFVRLLANRVEPIGRRAQGETAATAGATATAGASKAAAINEEDIPF